MLVRDGESAIVLEADQLIAWRTLQIVVGAPYLPEVQALRCHVSRPPRRPRGASALPIGLDGAEPALAACAAARLPVTATWIEYDGGRSG